MTRVLFYVSGHGYGHCVRMVEVIRALLHADPGCHVFVRTIAPPSLFDGLPNALVQVDPVNMDTGVVEDQHALRIDVAETVKKLEAFLENKDAIVDAEVDFASREKISLIVADIPYLAGEVAHRAGVPCLAIANFTWDWIYEPYLAAHPHRDRLLNDIREGYRKMGCLLRLPFHHEVDVFREVIDVPLVVRKSERTPVEIFRAMRLEPADGRQLVLLAARDPMSISALAHAAKQGRDFVFVCFQPSSDLLPENTQCVTIGPELTFSDVIRVCDFAITKLGYGMLAECIASRTALLFPTRSGFPEDAMLRAGAARYLRARELSQDDYEEGRWTQALRKLDHTSTPDESLSMDGARVCAENILGQLA